MHPRKLPFSRRWADRIPPDAVTGDTLIHTDLTPRNLLVHDGHAWVIDWTNPCIGAPWIPYALLIIRLIRAGHTPAAAEDVVSVAEAWQGATPYALDCFAAAAADLWRGWHQTIAAPHHLPLAEAAEAWSAHRAVG
ncbi:phosphotransferase [Catenuloplanes atrovinosus]|uniref:phosphotransferase n=1 Tax=Catenuloplanes atrovinosus TaxID=137266 RepID=UPI0035B50110